MSAVQLGPRAALILGFLAATPRTEAELLNMATVASERSQSMTLRLAARELVDAGPAAIRTSLERIASIDWARAIPDPEGGNLWVATMPSRPSKD